jgi:hypothetical protein
MGVRHINWQDAELPGLHKHGEVCTGESAGLLKGWRVLVVDDEEAARELIRR